MHEGALKLLLHAEVTAVLFSASVA